MYFYYNDSVKNICFLFICCFIDFIRFLILSVCFVIIDDFQLRGFNAKSRRNLYLFCCNIEYWKFYLFCLCVYDSSYGFGIGIRQVCL